MTYTVHIYILYLQMHTFFFCCKITAGRQFCSSKANFCPDLINCAFLRHLQKRPVDSQPKNLLFCRCKYICHCKNNNQEAFLLYKLSLALKTISSLLSFWYLYCPYEASTVSSSFTTWHQVSLFHAVDLSWHGSSESMPCIFKSGSVPFAHTPPTRVSVQVVRAVRTCTAL